MYDPKGNGKDRSVQDVEFIEAEPPQHLQGIVHRYLSLKTVEPLPADYRFHALPDACTYIVFNQLDPSVAGAAQLRATSEEFNLGKSFHFVNIRFLPGVWKGRNEPISIGAVKQEYRGQLPLWSVNASLAEKRFSDQQSILSRLVEQLVDEGFAAPNPVIERIFAYLDDIVSVADMAEAAGLSPRQLQRVLKSTTGFTPHDFLKVLRLQQSLKGEDTWSYADQSHFIHSFRRATGYTPGKYNKKFDV